MYYPTITDEIKEVLDVRKRNTVPIWMTSLIMDELEYGQRFKCQASLHDLSRDDVISEIKKYYEKRGYNEPKPEKFENKTKDFIISEFIMIRLRLDFDSDIWNYVKGHESN